MEWKMPISRGQSSNITDDRSRGCSSELACWWLHPSRKDFTLQMIYTVTVFATGALQNWVSERSRLSPGCSFWCSVIGRSDGCHCAASSRRLRSGSWVGESKIMPNQSVPRASSLKEAAAERKQRGVHRICISCFICMAARKLRNKMGNYIATGRQAGDGSWPCRTESKPRTLEVSHRD